MNLGFVHSFALEGQLTSWGRGQEAIAWSNDNQVAVVHKKGVNIYECHQTPGLQRRPPVLTAFPSQIDGPGRLFVPNTGDVPVTDIMDSKYKQDVFELLRDPILRPHGFDGMLFPNNHIKGIWSIHPFYRGLHNEARCILALLTSSNRLLIYGRQNRRYSNKEEWTDSWEIIMDVSAEYNEILLNSFWKVRSNPNIAATFDEYKERLYELAIVDFLWMPNWDLESDHVVNNSDEIKCVFKSFLMTFHANGEACIWKIKASKMVKPGYTLRLIFKSKILDEAEVFSSSSFISLSPKLGMIAIGTNQGKIKVVPIEKIKKIRVKKEVEVVNKDETVKKDFKFGNYVILKDETVKLWEEEDLMRIEFIRMSLESSGNSNAKITLAAVKHSNFLIATSISVNILSKKISSKEFSILKLSLGPIVGLSETSEGLFVVSHETGQLSIISWDGKDLEYLPESKIEIYDPLKNKKKKTKLFGAPVQKLEKKKKKLNMPANKRLIFQGLGMSPNKTLLCISRTVGMYHDHLKIRRPSHLVFYSLLPKDCMWSYVQKLFEENHYSLKAISDVLVPFRFHLRGKGNDSIYKEILEWAVPLEEKKTEELRLLYWCLKVKPGLPSTEWEVANAEIMFNPKATRRLTAINHLAKYRLDLIIDKIMQRRCSSLIQVVLENQEEALFSITNSELNKQSLKAMFQFLESKKDLPKFIKLPPMPKLDPPPHLPQCYWCKGPIEFPIDMGENESPLYQYNDVIDEGLKTDLDSERLTGFKWKERRHPVKEFGSHMPEICVISLVPIQFPYRKCFNCPVTCLLEPSFGQLPYCPLCNSFMFPCQLPMDVPPEESNEAERQAHSQAICIKSEPREELLNDEGEEFTDIDPAAAPPIQKYQYVTIMPTISTEAVGNDWGDQILSSDEDDSENEIDEDETSSSELED